MVPVSRHVLTISSASDERGRKKMAALKRNSKGRRERERGVKDGQYLLSGRELRPVVWQRPLYRLLRSRHVKVLAAKPDVLPATLYPPRDPPPKRRTTLTSKQIRFLLVRQKKKKKKKETTTRKKSLDRHPRHLRFTSLRNFIKHETINVEEEA